MAPVPPVGAAAGGGHGRRGGSGAACSIAAGAAASWGGAGLHLAGPEHLAVGELGEHLVGCDRTRGRLRALRIYVAHGPGA